MLKIASTRENSAVCMRGCNLAKFRCPVPLYRWTLRKSGIAHSSRLLSLLMVFNTINLKIKKFDIFISTSKHMDKKHRSPEIVLTPLFTRLLINLNFLPLNASLCLISWFPPNRNNWDKIGPFWFRKKSR